MESCNIIIGSAISFALILGAFFFFRRRGKKEPLTEMFKDFVVDSSLISKVEGELNFEDIVAFFKGMNLKKEKHVPFVANAKLFDGYFSDCKFEKEVVVFVGVYNSEDDKIEDYRLIEADAYDEKTKSVLGEDKLVVLN